MTRLTRIQISGFRGFNDPVDISLDADVVIVAGQNGSGKTSLFDAIQWLLLGHVSRLKNLDLTKAEDGGIANKYSSSPAFVEGTFATEAGELRVSRRLIGSDSVFASFLGDEPVGLEQMRDAFGVWPLEAAMFSRAVMLQQDEVREFLCADTKDRYRFLADLAGLEDIQRLDQQMRSELKRLREANRDLRAEADRARMRDEALARQASGSRAIVEQQARVDEERLREAKELLTRMFRLSESMSASDVVLAARERADEAVFAISQAREHTEIADRAAERAEALEPALAAIVVSTEGIETTEQLHEQLRGQIERLERDVQMAQSHAARTTQFAALALERLADICPVCQQTFDRAHAEAHLRELSTASASTGKAIRELERLKRELSDVEAQRQAHAESLRVRTQERDELEAVRASHARAVEQAVAAEETAAKALLADGMALDGMQERVADVKLQIQRLESALNATEERRTTELRLASAGMERDEQRSRGEELLARSAELEARLSRADAVVKWLGPQIVSATADVVGDLAPLVNEIYTRLDVHPTFRRFEFRSDRRNESGHLRPWILDDEAEADGNAAQILSSAQQNALAVCLFLALNLRTQDTVAFAVLDDPIQNMDDVNVLSFADILRTVRTRRQLFVSTHDERLARLLWRKLRPLREQERTMMLRIGQWTHSGPTVETDYRRFSPVQKPREIVGKA